MADLGRILTIASGVVGGLVGAVALFIVGSFAAVLVSVLWARITGRGGMKTVTERTDVEGRRFKVVRWRGARLGSSWSASIEYRVPRGEQGGDDHD